jgi:hypothetical protein
MAPTIASVVRARYWLQAVIRTAAGVVLAVTAVKEIAWTVGCAFSMEGVLSVFRLFDFWQSMSPAPVAVLLLVFSERLVRWVFPLPRPVCPECGYMVSPGALRCPECGLARDGAIGD